jgi:hypothetical protein
MQPGARRRGGRVKFQCPGCRSEGHDKSKDNATVFEDGRWGCALDRAHKGAISLALGVVRLAPIEVSMGVEEVENLPEGDDDPTREVDDVNLP